MDSNHSEAKFRVSLREGVVELNGTEAFVSQQIENFKDAIVDALTKATSTERADENEEGADNTEQPGPPPAPPKPAGESKTFPSVFHISGDQITLIKSIPGADKAKRAVNVALAYLWAKRSKGTEKVLLSEIRTVCTKQACVDTNFAKNIASAREWIVVDGAKGTHHKVCELTTPGIAEAERLLGEIDGS